MVNRTIPNLIKSYYGAKERYEGIRRDDSLETTTKDLKLLAELTKAMLYGSELLEKANYKYHGDFPEEIPTEREVKSFAGLAVKQLEKMGRFEEAASRARIYLKNEALAKAFALKEINRRLSDPDVSMGGIVKAMSLAVNYSLYERGLSVYDVFSAKLPKRLAKFEQEIADEYIKLEKRKENFHKEMKAFEKEMDKLLKATKRE